MFIKTAHNRVIYDQETAWLKKIDSQTTICKIFWYASYALKGRLAMDIFWKTSNGKGMITDLPT